VNNLHIYERDIPNLAEKDSKIALWNNHDKKNNYISIPKYLDENGINIKAKYLKFISDLGKKKKLNKNLNEHLQIDNHYNLWWMSLLTEKSPYKSKRIKDCLKLIALEEIILKDNYSKIYLNFFDENINTSIVDLCKNLKIEYVIKKNVGNLDYKIEIQKKSILSKIYNKSPCFVQALFFLIKYISLHWTATKFKKHNFLINNKKILFFSYLIHLDKNLYKKSKFTTGQWGPIPKLLKELSIKSNWVHHFIESKITPNISDGVNLINKFNENPNINGIHQYLSSYLSVRLISKVLINYFKILFKFPILINFKNLFLSEKSGINLWSLLKDDYINSISGPKLIENLIFIELFDIFLAKIPYQEKGIYLQENQSWESALIYAWKKNKHGKLLGLNNGFVRFWDTRFFDDYNTLNDLSNFKKPLPDELILTDSIAMNYYLKSGYPANKLIKAETVRYFNLLNNLEDKKINEKKNKVLILGDIVFKTTNEMIRALEEVQNNEYNWSIKSHPGCPLDIDNYQKIQLDDLSNENLDDIISKFDLVIAPAATLSVLEAYIKNIKIIIYLGHDEINISPLRDFKDIKIVNDVSSMKKALEYNCLLKYNYERKDIFWHDQNLTLWKKILN